jgi:hypothetical protein
VLSTCEEYVVQLPPVELPEGQNTGSKVIVKVWLLTSGFPLVGHGDNDHNGCVGVDIYNVTSILSQRHRVRAILPPLTVLPPLIALCLAHL